MQKGNLTDAGPIWDGLLDSTTRFQYGNRTGNRIIDAGLFWALGDSTFLGLPLEFQAGLMMQFCAERGCRISLQAPQGPGDVWLADNGFEAFAHEEQFTALRDCLADAMARIDKDDVLP